MRHFGGRAFDLVFSSGVGARGRASLRTVGDTPSKKNSRKLVCRGSRPRSFPSDNYREWHERNVAEIEANGASLGTLHGLPVRMDGGPIENVRFIAVDFWASSKRRADCSNKLESILDLLVDTAIIADDNWFEVPTVIASFNGVDRENPRAEVNIFYA